MRNAFFIAIFSLIFFSCDKYECVKTAAPDMIGEWTHLSEKDGFHHIFIQENSRGHLWGENDHGNTQDTQSRGWYIKDDVLYFSRYQNKAASEKFIIDQYPSTSDSVISLEFDTIPVGTKFMKLNGRTYRKLN